VPVLYSKPDCNFFMIRNMNHILTNFLNAIRKPSEDPLTFELVACILKSCPDQLHFYLPFLRQSCLPRCSNNWLQSAAYVRKVCTEIWSNYFLWLVCFCCFWCCQNKLSMKQKRLKIYQILCFCMSSNVSVLSSAGRFFLFCDAIIRNSYSCGKGWTDY